MNTAAAIKTLDVYAGDGSLIVSVSDSNAFELSAPDILARYPAANHLVISYGDCAAATVYLYAMPGDADLRDRGGAV